MVYSQLHTYIITGNYTKMCFFLEALVSGSKKPAENGQLVILVAGEKLNLYALVLTVLSY